VELTDNVVRWDGSARRCESAGGLCRTWRSAWGRGLQDRVRDGNARGDILILSTILDVVAARSLRPDRRPLLWGVCQPA
jgi:hypothetical protein